MNIDKISKAQIVLAGISWLALIQMALTKSYVISAILMFACFVGYKILCDYEVERRRKKYLARKKCQRA